MMRESAIEPGGPEVSRAAVRRGGRGGWRGGALALAMVAFAVPGLVPASAEARDDREWPTYADDGPGSGPRYVLVPAQELAPQHAVVAGRELVVVQKQPELTRRQKRLLRRAERHARKAAALRAKSKADEKLYVVAAPRPMYGVVVAGAVQPRERCDTRRPKVVVAHAGPPHGVAVGHRAKKAGARKIEGIDAAIARGLAVDVEAIQADIDRQVAQAMRGVERAQANAERAAQRHAEKAMRTAEKALRHGEAIERLVERALRDGVIDEAERAKIGAAARAASRDD